jgi:hypothetical protein
LTSADDLKKVEEQFECGDFAKARELVQQLKCQCANDPVLDFYEAAAAALAAAITAFLAGTSPPATAPG